MIGGGGGVPIPMSVLAGVAGEVISSLLCEDSGGVVGGFRADRLGDVAVSSGGEVGRRAISSRMDLRLGGWYMGMNFLRNFLFLSVCLPEPSILMRYWWNWHTSMTMPVRSHLFE